MICLWYGKEMAEGNSLCEECRTQAPHGTEAPASDDGFVWDPTTWTEEDDGGPW